MTTSSYDIGDQRRLTVTFTDINDVDADPTAIHFIMNEPDGVQTSHAYGDSPAVLIKSAVGIYYVDWLITKQGRHHYKFTGTGAVVAAESGEFYARRGEIV